MMVDTMYLVMGITLIDKAWITGTMWKTQCHKPTMTGNGLYRPFVGNFGMVYYCFTRMMTYDNQKMTV